MSTRDPRQTEHIPFTAAALGMLDQLAAGQSIDEAGIAALRRTIAELVETIDRVRGERDALAGDRDSAVDAQAQLAQKVEKCERSRRLLAEMLRNALDELLSEERG